VIRPAVYSRVCFRAGGFRPPQYGKANMSDDPQKIGLGGQNAICASASPYLSASCDGVFVISETTRNFRSLYISSVVRPCWLGPSPDQGTT
jgi:hypothetical protein